LFDELSLRSSSRQRRDNVNVISNTTDVHEFGTEVAADGRDVGVHARPHFAVEPWFAILSGEDHVKDDLTQRLQHGGMMTKHVP